MQIGYDLLWSCANFSVYPLKKFACTLRLKLREKHVHSNQWDSQKWQKLKENHLHHCCTYLTLVASHKISSRNSNHFMKSSQCLIRHKNISDHLIVKSRSSYSILYFRVNVGDLWFFSDLWTASFHLPFTWF